MSEAFIPQEQEITLPNDVVIRFVSLSGGQLILAERIRGNPTKADMMTAMGQSGITCGQLDENIEDLTKEVTIGEVPVAAARMVHLPIETSSELFTRPQLDEFIHAEELGDLNQLDVTFPVQEGQPLLAIVGPPKTVIESPDGQLTVQKEQNGYDPEVIAGDNTTLDVDRKTLLSSMDGYASRDKYGVVSVYPVERVRAIGEIHARVAKPSA
ncbi:MAG: hypothetical protein JSU61_03480, partial [Fidelibacterota bacterium]